MFLVPWLESLRWLIQYNPYKVVKERRLNFITIHYLYIISMSILASILLYPAGGLDYIDALFFASGCATQSGLNTVDINRLNTYQQIVLYFIPMFCTPIFIHSSVVVVRLYWFERRFQKIVKDARNFRRSRSRTRTEAQNDPESTAAEKGVRGRSIVVLHDNATHAFKDKTSDLDEKGDSGTASEASQANQPQQQTLPFRRDITFADELPRHDVNRTFVPTVPQQVSPEQHIAIRENQRNPKDKSALRIPGPRDFDQGQEPEPLDFAEDGGETAHVISSSQNRVTANGILDDNAGDDPHTGPLHHLKLNITSFPRLTKRRSESKDMANAPTEDIPPHSARMRPRVGTFSSLKEWASRDNDTVAPYLSWQPTIGRNSAFVDLTEEQREELGGVEYRSLKTLVVVLVSYYLCFHLLGVIVMVPWIVRTPTWGSVVRNDGISRVWWGIFSPASMFNDLGYTLTPDSFQSFQKAMLPLILGSYLIIIGNTGFPCMLRLVIWICAKVSQRGSAVWEEFMFLLDHPRRCFTLLFPAPATWWLFWILVALNGVDILFFIILDLNDETINSINPPGYRVLNGLFQAASTRTAGFASVSLSGLHPGIQVSYMIMMYISVFPIAISMRRTNVYEEKSLGIYTSTSEDVLDEKEPSYVGAHLRKQLSFDLWYIFLGLFIIAVAEGRRLENTNEYAFTLFSVLFEIVSAYGTVGLSLGYPDYNPSFSGQFGVISKLVIIAMQIRGRHRGLPYELDRAVLLPSDRLHNKEDVDASRRVQRRNSMLVDASGPAGHELNSRVPTVSKTPTQGRGLDQAGLVHASGRQPLAGNDIDNEPPRHSGHLRRGIGKLMAEVADESS